MSRQARSLIRPFGPNLCHSLASSFEIEQRLLCLFFSTRVRINSMSETAIMPDNSGWRRPVPIPGSEFILNADAVIVAIGNSPNPLVAKVTLERYQGGWRNRRNSLKRRLCRRRYCPWLGCSDFSHGRRETRCQSYAWIHDEQKKNLIPLAGNIF